MTFERRNLIHHCSDFQVDGIVYDTMKTIISGELVVVIDHG